MKGATTGEVWDLGLRVQRLGSIPETCSKAAADITVAAHSGFRIEGHDAFLLLLLGPMDTQKLLPPAAIVYFRPPTATKKLPYDGA